MTNPCGITGPIHSAPDVTQLTPEGAVSTMRTVYPTDAEETTYDKPTKVGKKVISVEKIVKKVKDAVRDFVQASTREAAAKEQKEEAANLLRNYVTPLRDANAYNGDYQKSYRVAGIVATTGLQYGVGVSQQDRVNLPKKETEIAAIKALVGKDFFDKMFSKDVTISIKKEVIENKATLKELSIDLVEKFGVEGLKKYFKKEEVWTVNKGFDLAQYRLEDAVRKQLLELVTMYADQVSDESFDPKNHL